MVPAITGQNAEYSLRVNSPLWASKASLARSREARFARLNRRACSQAMQNITRPASQSGVIHEQSVFTFGSDRYFFKHYFIPNFMVITLRGGGMGVSTCKTNDKQF